MQWLSESPPAVNQQFHQAALQRQSILTKPPGSLGRLEAIAVQLAGLQQRQQPSAENVFIGVFAGDHGVADEGVSAFPQAVTVEMIRNFANGGAAISVLARQLQAEFVVVNTGTASDCRDIPGVLHRPVARGTANFKKKSAMSELELEHALDVGREVAELARQARADVFIGGEMGIANTTSASAIGAALLGLSAEQLVGPGTGVNAKGVRHKADVVHAAIRLHAAHLSQPLEVLRRLGGFEIAALVGAYIRAAQLGIPVLVDGFISTAAALVAERINPGLRPWLMVSHRSAEPAHGLLIDALDTRAILQLDMRLGEGSGAALAVSILRAACALHNEMASFEDAGVSGAI